MTFIAQSLITECFSQIFDTGRAISLTYVTFHVECSGIIQYFNFFLYQCNKNEKNLNYLVKPHERCRFGICFYMNVFFWEKSNLQHCQRSKSQFLTVLNFLMELSCLLFNQNISNQFISSSVCGF